MASRFIAFVNDRWNGNMFEKNTLHTRKMKEYQTYGNRKSYKEYKVFCTIVVVKVIQNLVFV